MSMCSLLMFTSPVPPPLIEKRVLVSVKIPFPEVCQFIISMDSNIGVNYNNGNSVACGITDSL